MQLPFSIGKLTIGLPVSILKVVGNGLIPFLYADGNVYLIDVSGNVQPLSDFVAGGTVLLITNDSITTYQTSADLNALYPSVKLGQMIACPNTVNGAQIYVLYDAVNGNWGAFNLQLV
ncbi:MAG: hypothetical protein ACRDE2_00010 [Chitinophagaceae bacterium]